MKCVQTDVAFTKASYKLNNLNLNNNNLKYLGYRLGKTGFCDSFKGIHTYVLT
jgi:hypothetical protein